MDDPAPRPFEEVVKAIKSVMPAQFLAKFEQRLKEHDFNWYAPEKKFRVTENILAEMVGPPELFSEEWQKTVCEIWIGKLDYRLYLDVKGPAPRPFKEVIKAIKSVMPEQFLAKFEQRLEEHDFAWYAPEKQFGVTEIILAEMIGPPELFSEEWQKTVCRIWMGKLDYRLYLDTKRPAPRPYGDVLKAITSVMPEQFLAKFQQRLKDDAILGGLSPENRAKFGITEIILGQMIGSPESFSEAWQETVFQIWNGELDYRLYLGR
jgi:hypothetical protein